MNKPRLIDVNELIMCIEEWYELCSPRTDLRDMVVCDTLDSVLQHIDDIPTAYDIGKVVEQLEKESYDSCHIDLNTPINRTWQIIDLDKAIEIVKGGAE